MYIISIFQKYLFYQIFGDDDMIKHEKKQKKPLTFYLERQALRQEIERTRYSIDSARNHFEQAVDPTLIDCYIYELNAAQLRYQFLLRRFKSLELEA